MWGDVAARDRTERTAAKLCNADAVAVAPVLFGTVAWSEYGPTGLGGVAGRVPFGRMVLWVDPRGG